MKVGTGNLNVAWSESSMTIGTFAFKARDSKTLSMTGQVTGGTNTRFLTGSGSSALVATPRDPCAGGPRSDRGHAHAGELARTRMYKQVFSNSLRT
jgi:hypothetical protein